MFSNYSEELFLLINSWIGLLTPMNWMKISVPDCTYIVNLFYCFVFIILHAVNSSVKDVQFIEIASIELYIHLVSMQRVCTRHRV